MNFWYVDEAKIFLTIVKNNRNIRQSDPSIANKNAQGTSLIILAMFYFMQSISCRTQNDQSCWEYRRGRRRWLWWCRRSRWTGRWSSSSRWGTSVSSTCFLQPGQPVHQHHLWGPRWRKKHRWVKFWSEYYLKPVGSISCSVDSMDLFFFLFPHVNIVALVTKQMLWVFSVDVELVVDT